MTDSSGRRDRLGLRPDLIADSMDGDNVSPQRAAEPDGVVGNVCADRGRVGCGGDRCGAGSNDGGIWNQCSRYRVDRGHLEHIGVPAGVTHRRPFACRHGGACDNRNHRRLPGTTHTWHTSPSWYGHGTARAHSWRANYRPEIILARSAPSRRRTDPSITVSPTRTTIPPRIAGFTDTCATTVFLSARDNSFVIAS